MAFANIPGRGLWFPEFGKITTAFPSISAVGPADAAGEKIAFVGQVFNKDYATKTINKVQFRFGTVDKAGGSGLRVSLQAVTTSAGPPAQPDGTQAQYRDIANADAGFASNTWYTTGLITDDGTDTGAKRSVTFGEWLAVVVEYDPTGWQSADDFRLSTAARGGAGSGLHGANTLLYTSSWADSLMAANVVLEFSDGTFGTIDDSWVFSNISSVAYNSGTAVADEYAMEFQVPFPCKVDAACFIGGPGSGADIEIILYDGTTPMTNGTIAFDYNRMFSAANREGRATFPGQVELAANTTYRLAFKPTTTNSFTLYYFDVAAAGHLQAHALGQSCCLTSRVNEGAWDGQVLTRRPYAGLRFCSFSDGAGGGGGGIRRPAGMTGGMRG